MAGMFSEEGTSQLLAQVIEHLQSGNLEQAQFSLDQLGFERMLKPIRDPAMGSRDFADPAAGFEVDRVHETGDQIRGCLRAIRRNDSGAALRFAEAAAVRWKKAQ